MSCLLQDLNHFMANCWSSAPWKHPQRFVGFAPPSRCTADSGPETWCTWNM